MMRDITDCYEQAVAELRALASNEAASPAEAIERARRRLEASARVLALLADQHRTEVLFQTEGRFLERLDREPSSKLVGDLVQIVPSLCSETGCGLLRVDEARRCLHVMAASAWSSAFVRWHEGLPVGPKRCPLSAATRAGASIMVDRIAEAASWPEWRDQCVVEGWLAGTGLSIASRSGGLRGVVVVYHRAEGNHVPPLDRWIIERIGRLAALVLERFERGPC
jgi:hypothetical protein